MIEIIENSNNKVNTEQLDKRFEVLKELLERLEPFGFSGTVLLAKEDEVLLNQGYGFMDYEKRIPMHKDAILSIGSISKQFTSTLLLRLQQEGKLNMQDSLGKFFDEVPDDKADITIHQLLTHTAGLANGLGGDFEEISTEDFLQLVWQHDLQSPPGKEFNYSNVGYSLGAIIAQKVTGKPYCELMQKLFKDLGITSASWFGDPKYGENNSVSYYVDGERMGAVYEWKGSWNPETTYWHILGNGGVTIAQHDMLTYIRALFGEKLLTEASLKQMLTPEMNDYGYGWDITDTPLGQLVTHNGGSSAGVASIARYYSDHEITLLVSSNTIINGFGMTFVIEQLIDRIL